jgi:hypothetical protein
MNLSIVYELLTKKHVGGGWGVGGGGVKVAKIGGKTKNNGGPGPAAVFFVS